MHIQQSKQNSTFSEIRVIDKIKDIHLDTPQEQNRTLSEQSGTIKNSYSINVSLNGGDFNFVNQLTYTCDDNDINGALNNLALKISDISTSIEIILLSLDNDDDNILYPEINIPPELSAQERINVLSSRLSLLNEDIEELGSLFQEKYLENYYD